MKKLMKKSSLLFAFAVAFAAFVMPSMASAVSWGNGGTVRHTLTSQNLSFSVLAADAGSVCSQTTIEGDVGSSQIVVTSAVFTGCAGTGGRGDRCTATAAATGLPWTATPSTGNVQIHGVNVDVLFGGGAPCLINGARVNVTGTLSNGVFSNSAHSLTFSGASGLTAHSSLFGSQPATVGGLITDDQRSLTVID
jgi:hypothetical protein